MPSQRLMYRVGNLHLSPVWETLPTGEQDAFNERVIATEEFADLPDPDKDLVRRGELEVSAGVSVEQNPAAWGDWAAIDAALDSGDLEALDAALETVGSRDGNGLGDDAVSPADLAELAQYDDEGDPETKGLVDDSEILYDADDDGWVG